MKVYFEFVKLSMGYKNLFTLVTIMQEKIIKKLNEIIMVLKLHFVDFFINIE